MSSSDCSQKYVARIVLCPYSRVKVGCDPSRTLVARICIAAICVDVGAAMEPSELVGMMNDMH